MYYIYIHILRSMLVSERRIDLLLDATIRDRERKKTKERDLRNDQERD